MISAAETTTDRYSYEMALSTFSFAARRAGKIAKNTPSTPARATYTRIWTPGIPSSVNPSDASAC